MKKQIFTLSFALCAAFGYSQTNIFPDTGNAGIGTTTPIYKLDMVYTLPNQSLYSTPPINFSFAGYRQAGTKPNPDKSSGLLTQFYATEGNFSSRLQYINANQNYGFIDLNAKSTTKTTIAAVSFGNNGIELMRINQNGKVRIGSNDRTTPDGYKLFVEEGILTEKVKVALSSTASWADYVFAPDYKLMPLEEVEQFTKENNHLPNVPSAEEMVTEGLDVAKMDAKLLEKIEELTLYVIEQNKKNEAQAKEIEELKAMMKVILEKK